jgi:hypothetical protein
MMEIETKKSETPDLRKFGLMFAIVLAVLFGALIPLIRHGFEITLWPMWPWAVALVMVSWSLIHPGSLGLVHSPWMKFASIAQWVNTRIIMLLLFYLLILPIGLLLRLFGKDSMHRRFDRGADSYRVKAETQDNKHMENPY